MCCPFFYVLTLEKSDFKRLCSKRFLLGDSRIICMILKITKTSWGTYLLGAKPLKRLSKVKKSEIIWENRQIESTQVTIRVTNKCIWQINRELRTNVSIRESTNWQVHKHIILLTMMFYISSMVFSPLKGNLVMKGFSLNTDRLIMSECLQNSFNVVTLLHEEI